MRSTAQPWHILRDLIVGRELVVFFNTIAYLTCFRDVFQILNFSAPVVLRPQETAIPFVLKFHPNATQIHLNTKLIIHTNASTFVIPIIVYNGALQVSLSQVCSEERCLCK